MASFHHASNQVPPTTALRTTLNTPTIVGVSVLCHGNEISKITLTTMKRPNTIDSQTKKISAIREPNLLDMSVTALSRAVSVARAKSWQWS